VIVVVPHKDELLHRGDQARCKRDVPGRATAHLCARLFPVAGRNGIATIKGSLVNMRDGGFISQHDFHIASQIAYVVCGGDVDAGTMVTEQYLMALEREVFCALVDQCQDPGAHHGNDVDRQAGTQLIR
jgi:3-hydroxyacyl-CoA dehydrogenase